MNSMVLPAFIRESVVLDESDKEKLAVFQPIPSDIEVDVIRNLPDILELTNAFIGDENTRNTHLQLRAKEYIEEGNVAMAWKVLLL